MITARITDEPHRTHKFPLSVRRLKQRTALALWFSGSVAAWAMIVVVAYGLLHRLA